MTVQGSCCLAGPRIGTASVPIINVSICENMNSLLGGIRMHPRCNKKAALFVVLGLLPSAMAMDGVNPLQFNTFNGWKAFELVTQGDDIGLLSDTGYGSTVSRGIFDGLGIQQSGDNLTVFVNHEIYGAAISRVDMNPTRFQQAIASTIDDGVTAFPSAIVTGMGYAYETIFDATFHGVTNLNPVASGTVGVGSYGDIHFDRFCSGTSYLANSFGANRGFADEIYITGEEVGGGRFYALDPVARALWEIPEFGRGRWENAALIDTGNTTHIAMVLSSDVGTGLGDFIRLFVGVKNVDANQDGSLDFLERNGLQGDIYFFEPDGTASTTDLPDGTVSGVWSTAKTNALRETKLEDIHTNPHDGTQLVFADQNDGVYIMDLDLVFADSNFDAAASSVIVSQIDDNNVAPIGAPDNLTWSADGKIYVQEDGNGNEIWQMNPDGSQILQIAKAFSEPSGIIDISEVTGYKPGSVLLSSIMGTGSHGAQLAVLVSPAAGSVLTR